MPSGIDVLETTIGQGATGYIVFRESLKTSAGVEIPIANHGNVTLQLFQLNYDGSMSQWDFNGATNGFTSSSVTTSSVVMSVPTTQGGSYTSSGIWTYSMTIPASVSNTNFVTGGIYIYKITDSTGGSNNAFPTSVERQFQFGGTQGDMTVTSTGNLAVDLQTIKTHSVVAAGTTTFPTGTLAMQGSPVPMALSLTVNTSYGGASGFYYPATFAYSYVNNVPVWTNGTYSLWYSSPNWVVNAIGSVGSIASGNYWISSSGVNISPYGLSFTGNGLMSGYALSTSLPIQALNTNFQTVDQLIQNNGGTICFSMQADPVSPVVSYSTNGGASFGATSSQTISTVASANAGNGIYSFTLATTETNTIGQLIVKVVNAGVTYYIVVSIVAGTVGQIGLGYVGALNPSSSGYGNNGDFSIVATSPTVFSTHDHDYNNMWLMFTTGNNTFIPRVIGNYIGATQEVQFTGTGMRGAFPENVAPGDTFQILAGSP